MAKKSAKSDVIYIFDFFIPGRPGMPEENEEGQVTLTRLKELLEVAKNDPDGAEQLMNDEVTDQFSYAFSQHYSLYEPKTLDKFLVDLEKELTSKGSFVIAWEEGYIGFGKTAKKAKSATVKLFNEMEHGIDDDDD